MEITCSICLDKTSRRDVTLSACKHVFHAECLSHLFNDICPLCRAPISEGDLDDDALGTIKKRKKDEKAAEEERNLLELQTYDGYRLREAAWLPGSRMFHKLLSFLIETFPLEYLLSFQTSGAFVRYYHNKLHTVLCLPRAFPCHKIAYALTFIHSLIFSIKAPNRHIDMESDEYEMVMKFILPRSRIDPRIAVNLLKEIHPEIGHQKVAEYFRAAEFIATGVDLCQLISQEIAATRR